ncbi:hypothetical protein SLEP1_g30475 [Rubroshorea leprosula]|uniref:SUPPRESSOR OF ABI3-5-like n=1 Tax=Rubroshorea leprosula TaxID=152421 RepID=A0AAV5K8K3_9ROSI|nr:hypothetical protein SLEP1_g30475 [Rubroshorea leprosula]
MSVFFGVLMIGSSYDGGRFLDERYSRDNVYPRNAYYRDPLGREKYPPPPGAGLWPQSRRRSYEEEYPLDRYSRRHQKPYIDSHNKVDTFHDHDMDSFQDFHDGYRGGDDYQDHEFDRSSRIGGHDRGDYGYDDYDYRPRISHQNREDSRERDYEYGRHGSDSDYDRGSWRDGNWRRRESRERERDKRSWSRERDQSPRGRHDRSRSQSRGHDDRSRSRSPRGRSHGRSHREDSYEDGRNERTEKRRDREDKYMHDRFSVVPSATIVVKGLSQKITEEDLYQILAEWGPLRHVRVIKERNSGISRGFAFVDFPSVGAAQAMMDRIGDDGLVVDGRKLFFEYSSKPTGASGAPFGHESSGKSGHSGKKSMTMPSDWMCTICGCVNFARRTSCFQCNEPRADDAPLADMSLSNSASLGKKGSESGPTHVLVVRGLDENADEEMLRYEFSKHAPIKDLRLVRDKFTHVSRGFAFVHFHSVEDATKALEAANGTTLEKNGQILRVAYAKSILGPGSGTSVPSQSSSLAAAAIEAAAFAQQYDAVGWTPKEYNPNEKESAGRQDQGSRMVTIQQDGSNLQSGFVWDEASGYYYDAASGFYYDGNTGLYYDGNNGIWYSYDHQNQQYIPCNDQNDNKATIKQSESSKAVDGSNNRKVVISAPAATVPPVEKAASLPDAVQAAATAAIAAEKREKEKAKEIKLSSKSSILANKKKMNNVLSMWKQRSHEGQATRLALDDNQLSSLAEEKPSSVGQYTKSKAKSNVSIAKDNISSSFRVDTTSQGMSAVVLESPVKSRPISNSSGGTLMGVIRGSTRGLGQSDMSGSCAGASTSPAAAAPASLMGSSLSTNLEAPIVGTPFRTDASALGSYAPSVVVGSGKRRFSETPLPSKEQPQTTYRDRAAERRSLYGSSSSIGDNMSELELGNSNQDFALKKVSSDPMPFPPGVGGGRGVMLDDVQSYELITADKAIDEKNVGNRMLRNMGWQEGLGLGKDGSGMVEPVQAQAIDSRAGLGSNQKKAVDPSLEVQAGDSYKTVIQKKALARFREMS